MKNFISILAAARSFIIDAPLFMNAWNWFIAPATKFLPIHYWTAYAFDMIIGLPIIYAVGSGYFYTHYKSEIEPWQVGKIVVESAAGKAAMIQIGKMISLLGAWIGLWLIHTYANQTWNP